jgi:hypothetical protein
MHSFKFAGLPLLTLALTAGAAAQGFKPYPGATRYNPPDTKETRDAMKALPAGTTTATYTTTDSFEKVVAFYKGSAREYQIPGMRSGGKLPNGQEMKHTFLIFDAAADITTSRSWAKVQHPFIGSVDFKAGAPEYKDIRDVTAIVLTEKK